jgi:hypothetical protein
MILKHPLLELSIMDIRIVVLIATIDFSSMVHRVTNHFITHLPPQKSG